MALAVFSLKYAIAFASFSLRWSSDILGCECEKLYEKEKKGFLSSDKANKMVVHKDFVLSLISVAAKTSYKNHRKRQVCSISNNMQIQKSIWKTNIKQNLSFRKCIWEKLKRA